MSEQSTLSRRVLIVDDEPPNIRLLEAMLRAAGYANVRGTTDPLAVLPHYAKFRPDILLLDLHMPGLTGFEVMGRLREVVGR
jgi:CheY-like chemotaxis protein